MMTPAGLAIVALVNSVTRSAAGEKATRRENVVRRIGAQKQLFLDDYMID